MSKLDEMREEKYWHIYLTALIGCGEAEGNPGLTPIMPAWVKSNQNCLGGRVVVPRHNDWLCHPWKKSNSGAKFKLQFVFSVDGARWSDETCFFFPFSTIYFKS